MGFEEEIEGGERVYPARTFKDGRYLCLSPFPLALLPPFTSWEILPGRGGRTFRELKHAHTQSCRFVVGMEDRLMVVHFHSAYR